MTDRALSLSLEIGVTAVTLKAAQARHRWHPAREHVVYNVQNERGQRNADCSVHVKLGASGNLACTSFTFKVHLPRNSSPIHNTSLFRLCCRLHVHVVCAY
jgi:hypothetical protein